MQYLNRMISAIESQCNTRCLIGLETRLHTKQVAQLWQRDRTSLPSFSSNVQLYKQNHKIAFFSQLMGHQGNICALSENFIAKRLCSRVILRECHFYS